MKIRLFALAALLALPLASPAPATCADPCSIATSSFGYVPPAASISSGTSVTFDRTDSAPHVTADGTGSGVSADFCFSAPDSVPVRFDVDNGALLATVGDDTIECANAQALADGSFVLPYHCRLHPTMRGLIVVSA